MHVLYLLQQLKSAHPDDAHILSTANAIEAAIRIRATKSVLHRYPWGSSPSLHLLSPSQPPSSKSVLSFEAFKLCCAPTQSIEITIQAYLKLNCHLAPRTRLKLFEEIPTPLEASLQKEQQQLVHKRDTLDRILATPAVLNATGSFIAAQDLSSVLDHLITSCMSSCSTASDAIMESEALKFGAAALVLGLGCRRAVLSGCIFLPSLAASAPLQDHVSVITEHEDSTYVLHPRHDKVTRFASAQVSLPRRLCPLVAAIVALRQHKWVSESSRVLFPEHLIKTIDLRSILQRAKITLHTLRHLHRSLLVASELHIGMSTRAAASFRANSSSGAVNHSPATESRHYMWRAAAGLRLSQQLLYSGNFAGIRGSWSRASAAAALPLLYEPTLQTPLNQYMSHRRSVNTNASWPLVDQLRYTRAAVSVKSRHKSRHFQLQQVVHAAGRSDPYQWVHMAQEKCSSLSDCFTLFWVLSGCPPLRRLEAVRWQEIVFHRGLVCYLQQVELRVPDLACDMILACWAIRPSTPFPPRRLGIAYLRQAFASPARETSFRHALARGAALGGNETMLRALRVANEWHGTRIDAHLPSPWATLSDQ